VALSKGAKKGSLLIKDLDSVIIGICHHNLIISVIKSDTRGGVKLPISTPFRSIFPQKLPCSIKYLNAIVVCVSNDNFIP